MAKKKTKRMVRKLTGEEKTRRAKIREQVMEEFPPTKKRGHQPVRTGIAAELRRARKAHGLTYYAVAKRAAFPIPIPSKTLNTVGTQSSLTSKP